MHINKFLKSYVCYVLLLVTSRYRGRVCAVLHVRVLPYYYSTFAVPCREDIISHHHPHHRSFISTYYQVCFLSNFLLSSKIPSLPRISAARLYLFRLSSGLPGNGNRRCHSNTTNTKQIMWHTPTVPNNANKLYPGVLIP